MKICLKVKVVALFSHCEAYKSMKQSCPSHDLSEVSIFRLNNFQMIIPKKFQIRKMTKTMSCRPMGIFNNYNAQ